MLRQVLALFFTLAVLLSCQSGKKPASSVISTEAEKSLSDFWDRHDWRLDEDLDISEDRFAEFAELAAAAPKEEAVAALGALLDSLKAQDEVAYYIYAGWVEGAFYHPLSPCRDFDLYSYAVDRFATDGVFSTDECAPLLRKQHWMSLNLQGEKAVIPEADPKGRNTLVLVIDLSCPTCREALGRLANEWAEARHLAICCGHGNLPDVPGWEYQQETDVSNWFDLHMAPVYYVIDPAGVVIQSYTPAL